MTRTTDLDDRPEREMEDRLRRDLPLLDPDEGERAQVDLAAVRRGGRRRRVRTRAVRGAGGLVLVGALVGVVQVVDHDRGAGTPPVVTADGASRASRSTGVAGEQPAFTPEALAPADLAPGTPDPAQPAPTDGGPYTVLPESASTSTPLAAAADSSASEEHHLTSRQTCATTLTTPAPLVPGETLTLTGSGFGACPDGSATDVLDDDGVRLEQGTVRTYLGRAEPDRSDGSLAATLPLPADLVPGPATLRVGSASVQVTVAGGEQATSRAGDVRALLGGLVVAGGAVLLARRGRRRGEI